jgi:hypothetical protein
MKTFDEIPFYALGDAPEDLDEIEYRTIIAKRALVAAYEDPETVDCISDLLTDLRHLCDAMGQDFGALDRWAHQNYTKEIVKTKDTEGQK